MGADSIVFCFDYLDPLSFLLQGELDALAASEALPGVRRLPLELRPPPLALLDPEGPVWTSLWAGAAATAEALGARLVAPGLLPWTRKAHELALHANEKGVGEEVHRRLFELVFLEGRDVGRVDVLVEAARSAGLDATEAKAVLDVDRWAAEVVRLGEEARNLGAVGPPVLVRDGRTLQGFHNRDALRTFLLR